MIAALATALVLLTGPGQLVEMPPLAEIISTTATAEAPAERLDPPAPPPETAAPPTGSSASANGRCVGWEPLLAEYSPGWSVERMSRIAYRESRCQPSVRNRSSGSTGLLQIMPMHCAWLAGLLGGCSVQLLQGAAYNIRASAALWRRDGYRPWAL